MIEDVQFSKDLLVLFAEEPRWPSKISVADIQKEFPERSHSEIVFHLDCLAMFIEDQQQAVPENVWIGVSLENQDTVWRIDYLRRVPARVRFLSCEPLLGPLSLDLTGIHWVIVGGESGPGARPIRTQWVREIRKQCHESMVPFFFKQWGGVHKSKTGRLLDGRTWDQMPNPDRISQQIPLVIV